MHVLCGILDDFSDILQHLPDDIRACAAQLQTDGLSAVKQPIFTAKHVLELSTKTLSSMVALCRFAWLHSISFLMDSGGVNGGGHSL